MRNDAVMLVNRNNAVVLLLVVRGKRSNLDGKFRILTFSIILGDGVVATESRTKIQTPNSTNLAK